MSKHTSNNGHLYNWIGICRRINTREIWCNVFPKSLRKMTVPLPVTVDGSRVFLVHFLVSGWLHVGQDWCLVFRSRDLWWVRSVRLLLFPFSSPVYDSCYMVCPVSSSKRTDVRWRRKYEDGAYTRDSDVVSGYVLINKYTKGKSR